MTVVLLLFAVAVRGCVFYAVLSIAHNHNHKDADDYELVDARVDLHVSRLVALHSNGGGRGASCALRTMRPQWAPTECRITFDRTTRNQHTQPRLSS